MNDTTGAGDAFSAGSAVALAERQKLVEAVKFASLGLHQNGRHRAMVGRGVVKECIEKL